MSVFIKDNYDKTCKLYYQSLISNKDISNDNINQSIKEDNDYIVNYHILDDSLLIYAKYTSTSHKNLGINLAQKIKSANLFFEK